ncbi:hypothetical protein [Flavobacterium sharifuzzamanii]|uniref:hypothetical protein n=1 Tax=Flavobacterium sharifuzzamanii TaxID=2211133 RepID=UPI000DAD975A|nr:hypothetical protein [Flavobacterium sharifuzzamanii]KAF2079028.1 hypothetical protein DMA14_21315 [Flavobacterium sharifuzzamanii]
MAGGKITRIVGGLNSIECDTWTVYTNKFTAHAGQGSYFTADGGINLGDNPKDPPPVAKYFVKGWWTDKDNKPIKEARILDTVKFHIQTQGIDDPKGKKIEIKLLEYDTSVHLSLGTYGSGAVETRPFDDHVRIMSGKNEITELTLDENGKTAITINLTWGMHEMFNETFFGGFAEMGLLEFYFECSYGEDRGIWLPASLGDYLKVTISNQSLFIKPAYEGYNFPEIRTAEGDIVVFSAGIGLEHEPSNELEGQLDAIADKIKSEFYGGVREAMMKYSDNIRHTIAVRQLKKGYLANSLGKIEFSRRIYTKPVYDNSGKLYEITKAANFGYRKEGKTVTTKGISQLDYFREIGALNAVAKASKELLGIFNFASDVISFAMDENPKIIPTGFAPLDFLVAMVMPSISNPIIEVWDNVVFDLAEKAKDKGLKGINDFLLMPGANEKRYGYNIFEINQIVLNELLKGHIKKLEDLKNLQREKNDIQSPITYILFYSKQNQEDESDDKILIDSIFINFNY